MENNQTSPITSPASQYTPRAPTAAERKELLEWQMEMNGDDDLGFIDRCWAAVFDDYVTDCPGYAGRVMSVIWPANPTTCSIFTWEKGRLKHEATYD